MELCPILNDKCKKDECIWFAIKEGKCVIPLLHGQLEFIGGKLEKM